MSIESKISEAKDILVQLGLPKDQQNDRSALTLLALLDVKPESKWIDSRTHLIGVTPIMTWIKDNYAVEYAPNSRETFRRFTLHQFVEAGLTLYNPDNPKRAVNSPKACYSISPLALETIVKYKSDKWSKAIEEFHSKQESLTKQYAKARELEMIPVKYDGVEIILTPGKHNELIRDIVCEFASRFAPGCKLLYIGDTGQKSDFFDTDSLTDLKIKVDKHGKWPDVILYSEKQNWLYLIESVTSHGPMDSKRIIELNNLFKDSPAGLIFVTAFPTRAIMNKFLKDISWETEVWIAESPSHMIHFNGDRFMGPHE